jgi:hypothetical protein
MDEANDNRDPAGITALLRQIKQGDVAAESELIPLIYNQLQRSRATKWDANGLTIACRQPFWCTKLSAAGGKLTD